MDKQRFEEIKQRREQYDEIIWDDRDFGPDLDWLISKVERLERELDEMCHSCASLREILDCDKNPGMIGSPIEVILQAKSDLVSLAELKIRMPCGHRKKDMDDSYGECVLCKYKNLYHKEEKQLARLREIIVKTPDVQHAHYVNLTVRINGEYRNYEADWLKKLQQALKESEE